MITEVIDERMKLDNSLALIDKKRITVGASIGCRDDVIQYLLKSLTSGKRKKKLFRAESNFLKILA